MGSPGARGASAPPGQAAVQVATGTALVPFQLPVKPQVVLPPAGRAPLYEAFRAVTASPVPETVAFQVLVNR